MLRAAAALLLLFFASTALGQSFAREPPEKRQARKPQSSPAPASRSEKPARERAGIARTVDEAKSAPVESTPRRTEKPRRSIQERERPPSRSPATVFTQPKPPAERSPIARTVEEAKTAPIEREKRRLETPAPIFRQPKPAAERAPLARTVEEAKTAPIERERRPASAEVLVCSAMPQCTAVPASCRPVEHSYGGGNRGAALGDVVKSCRAANSFNACCAESCAASARCRPR